MRVPTTAASREVFVGLLPEGIPEPPSRWTAVAFDLHVNWPTAHPDLFEAQRGLAAGSAMDELAPREVVEVSGAAGKQEASRVRGGRQAPGGALVHVACALRTVAVLYKIEEAARDGGEQAAYGTPKPLRERSDGNTVGDGAVLVLTWWSAELCDLVAEPMADRGQEARLADQRSVLLWPVFKSEDECG